MEKIFAEVKSFYQGILFCTKKTPQKRKTLFMATSVYARYVFIVANIDNSIIITFETNQMI